MDTSLPTWHKLANSIAEMEFPAKGLLQIDVNYKKICVGLYKQVLYACAATCPHAGGTMADGYIDTAGNIVCPVHRYKFKLSNGCNTSGEGYFLKRFLIEERADGIFIAVD